VPRPVSVIIPTRDRPEALRGCLEALAAHNGAGGPMEIIVVDDGGRAPAEQVVARFADRLPVRCHRQAGAGPSVARNAGAALATGDWIVFLDDDCSVAADWLPRLQQHLSRHPGALVGGGAVETLDADRYAASHQLLFDYLYARLNPVRDDATFCASNNLAVPRERFTDLGGFDTNFQFAAGEDRDLCVRWRERGWPLVFAPDVRVSHTPAMTLSSFWSRHFRYGRGARVFHRRRAERGGHRHRVRPRFYLDLVLFPLRRAPAPRALLLVLLALLSQIATACGYVTEMLSPGAAPA
jgi:GT2 family glycosyltransferase